MIANIMAMIYNKKDSVEIDLFRSMTLNTLRSLNKKFKPIYGQMVIASDGRRSWRKDIFPYYKANRKKNREQSSFDWPQIFNCLNTIRDEIKEYFPYPVIHLENAEADDVIGVLVKELTKSDSENKIPILILSGDKDFIQLQSYSDTISIKQYDPINKKFITSNDPKKFMREHIIKGDTGDGIPNFLSKDNSLVDNIRQTSIFAKNLLVWSSAEDPREFCNEEMLRNYKRNECLINLNFTPDKIYKEVIEQFAEQNNKPRSKIMPYMIKHRLKVLMESISDF